jgi:hypothetical protein
MVAILFAREWFWEPSGRPTPPPPDGPAIEVRSARERRFSDQLKPSPVAEAMVSRLLLNGILNEVRDRECDDDDDDDDAERGDWWEGSEDKPRPFPSRAEIVPVDGTDVDAWRACCDEGAGGGIDLPFWGGLPSTPPPPLPPDLISLMARAPKLMRRANGVVGVVWSLAKSSSTADSSMLPLLAEPMLSPRPR